MPSGIRLVFRSIIFALVVPGIIGLLPSPASASAVTATLVQTIQTSQFPHPAPDPAGITYDARTDRLIVTDSEVEESPQPYWHNVSVWEVDRAGAVIRDWKAPNLEPTGLAFDQAAVRLFFSDDNAHRIYIRHAGTDGIFATGDDSLTSFATPSGDTDAEDVAYDSSTGDLFTTDGVGKEVYHIARGADGTFGTTDDVVTHFDTGVYGAGDPEGIEYDTSRSTLLVLDYVSNKVYELSKTGALLNTIDVSAANQTKAADVAIAPGSVEPGRRNLWLVDRGVDNEVDPNENDGKLYELRVPDLPSPTNTAPSVSISSPANNSSFVQGTSIQFTGTATDSEDGSLTSALVWTSNLSGQIGTGGSFTTSSLAVGTHTITASVTDSGGLTGSATRTVTVTATPPANTAPSVSISSPANNSSFVQGSSIQFTGTATDTEDGSLTNALVWTSNLSGQIGTGGSFTTSSLPLGTHTITASVTDSGGLTGSATRTVTVTDTGTVDVPVATGNDDAEESSAAKVTLNSTDLELVQERTTQTVGMRFAGVGVPAGATILSAYVQFTVDEATTTATSLLIQGQSAANPATFTTATGNVSSRTRTSTGISWTPVGWPTKNVRGVDQRTPSLVSLIQELTGQSGWASGNAMVLIVTGSGKRVADSFEGGTANRPVLHIEFQTSGSPPPPPPPNTAPSVSISSPANNSSFVQGSSIQFTGTATDTEDGSLTSGLVWTSNLSGQIGTGGSFTTSSLAVGTHTITASVTDSGGLSGSATRTVTITSGGGGVQTLDIPIAASSDDAEQSSAGAMSLTSTDLELVQESTTQKVGMRFTGIGVPVGATIVAAYVQFTVDEVSTATTSLTVRCQAADNPTTFTTATSNISSRTLGSASAEWAPVAWNTVGAAGVDQRTPSLNPVIQEVVSRPGWASGNAIVVIITGTGKRVASAYDLGTGVQPVLHIEYQV